MMQERENKRNDANVVISKTVLIKAMSCLPTSLALQVKEVTH